MTIARFAALMVLLLHSSAFGVAAVLDAVIASRANASVAHVEANGGATCVAHDESTCQLCRVANMTLCAAAQGLAVRPLARTARPSGLTQAHVASIARTALHSRAPPIA